MSLKMTVLDMVQNILNALESDEVNSISDTPEGTMIAEIIKEVYFQIVAQVSIPELNSAYFNLEGLGDTTKPTFLKIPDNIKEVFWFKYDGQDINDTQPVYSSVTFLNTETFFKRVSARDASDTDIQQITTNDGVPLLIWKDRKPSLYTVIDDKTIITDAYDSQVDTTLQGNKTVAAGQKLPTFLISDQFVPVLDDNLFPYLLAEAKAVAFTVLKQTQNPKIESQAREQKIRNQNERHRFSNLNRDNTIVKGLNFGRKRR